MNPEIVKIQTQIESLNQKLTLIQNSCPHLKFVDVKFDSNTGNYDPAEDKYWMNCRCKDCGRYLRFYSDQKEYRNFRFYT